MPKYRVIKSTAKNADRPYIIQVWQPDLATWETRYASSYKTLKAAQRCIKEWQESCARAETPAEVVWEEKDESCRSNC